MDCAKKAPLHSPPLINRSKPATHLRAIMDTAMAAVDERKLSLEEFHSRYDGEKPYFEYWDGEAVQKSMPTRLHALIQQILLKLLIALGYDSGPEITLKLDPAYEPI